MDVKELLSFKPNSTPARDSNSSSSSGAGAPPSKSGGGDRGRKRLAVAPGSDSGILKKPNLAQTIPELAVSKGRIIEEAGKGGDPLEGGNQGLEISEEERLRIIQMVEDGEEVCVVEFCDLDKN